MGASWECEECPWAFSQELLLRVHALAAHPCQTLLRRDRRHSQPPPESPARDASEEAAATEQSPQTHLLTPKAVQMDSQGSKVAQEKDGAAEKEAGELDSSEDALSEASQEAKAEPASTPPPFHDETIRLCDADQGVTEAPPSALEDKVTVERLTVAPSSERQGDMSPGGWDAWERTIMDDLPMEVEDFGEALVAEALDDSVIWDDTPPGPRPFLGRIPALEHIPLPDSEAPPQPRPAPKARMPPLVLPPPNQPRAYTLQRPSRPLPKAEPGAQWSHETARQYRSLATQPSPKRQRPVYQAQLGKRAPASQGQPFRGRPEARKAGEAEELLGSVTYDPASARYLVVYQKSRRPAQ